jgi:anti-anti-sigma factor
MNISLISDEGGVVRLRCGGEVKQDELRATNPIEDLLGPDGFARRVLLDLEKTSYIDSSGMGLLLVCDKRFREAGGKLVLHSLPPRVEQAIQFLRLHLILNIAVDDVGARAMAME